MYFYFSFESLRFLLSFWQDEIVLDPVLQVENSSCVVSWLQDYHAAETAVVAADRHALQQIIRTQVPSIAQSILKHIF
jgi:hypothetical protein